jgi:hypothetical protein
MMDLIEIDIFLDWILWCIGIAAAAMAVVAALTWK